VPWKRHRGRIDTLCVAGGCLFAGAPWTLRPIGVECHLPDGIGKDSISVGIVHTRSPEKATTGGGLTQNVSCSTRSSFATGEA
jgi:hypothetical protein